MNKRRVPVLSALAERQNRRLRSARARVSFRARQS